MKGEWLNDKRGSVFSSHGVCKCCDIQLRHYEIIDYHNDKCEYCQNVNRETKNCEENKK